MATLIIQSVDATSPDRVMRVEGKIVYIGRSPKCTVQLNDPTVSRLHAALTRQADGSWALVRHKAAQPVWIDGEAVDKKPLRGGESIRIGGFTILFQAENSPVAGVDDETVRGQPVVALPEDATEATLWFEAGGPGAESLPLTRVVTVFGRGEECDVVLDDQRCSRRHMEISRVGDAFVLRDLGSTNGVLVNGERATGEVELVSGDVIQVGGARMRFELDDELEPLTIPATAPVADAALSDPPLIPTAPSLPVAPAAAQGLVDRWTRATPFTQVASALAAAMIIVAGFFIATVWSRRDAMQPQEMAARPAGQKTAAPVKRGDPAPEADDERVAATIEQPESQPESEPDPVATEESEPRNAEVDDAPLLALAKPRKPRDQALEPMRGSGKTAKAAAEDDDFADAEDAEESSEPDRKFADLLEQGESKKERREKQREEPVQEAREEASEETSDETAEEASHETEGSEAAKTARLAVPDEAEVAAALASIKEVYAEDLADSRALGPTLSKLLSAAKKSSKPASKYALLIAAEQKAVQSGDFAEAIDVIDERAEMFDVDALQCRLDMLREASKTAADANAEIYVFTVKVAGDAIDAERFEVATKAAGLAAHVAVMLDQQSLAKVVRSPFGSNASGPGAGPAPATKADGPRRADSAKHLRLAVSECKKLHQKYEQARAELAQTPGDEKASETVGKYLCFVRGDWQAGLRALAAGEEGVLRSLAERELALMLDAGADPAKVFALAGDWWALADAPRRSADLPALAAATVKHHAAGIYEWILGKLSDPIEAELAKKRIAAAADESPPWRVEPRSRDEL
ncbi:MAG: FHA domain-containing protein [Planctomycetia bacterium]|jgi:pSer/pThr/pTyr-binding forkhead associated (FHA) protein